MSTDFGNDINTPGLLDLDPHFTFVTGGELIGQAAGRRLVTPRGSLIDDPLYGYDVRVHLNDDSPDVAVIQTEVAAELVKDERISKATATVTFDEARELLTIEAFVLTALGPFRLVLEVSAVTVSLLTVQAA